jgi:hypothetical protein
MSQSLRYPGRIPRGWLDLAHVLAGAPARRRAEFALTEPMFFRSECFVEDLDLLPSPPCRSTKSAAPSRRVAALLCAVPVCAALLGGALTLLERVA